MVVVVVVVVVVVMVAVVVVVVVVVVMVAVVVVVGRWKQSLHCTGKTELKVNVKQKLRILLVMNPKPHVVKYMSQLGMDAAMTDQRIVTIMRTKTN